MIDGLFASVNPGFNGQQTLLVVTGQLFSGTRRSMALAGCRVSNIPQGGPGSDRIRSRKASKSHSTHTRPRRENSNSSKYQCPVHYVNKSHTRNTKIIYVKTNHSIGRIIASFRNAISQTVLASLRTDVRPSRCLRTTTRSRAGFVMPGREPSVEFCLGFS